MERRSEREERRKTSDVPVPIERRFRLRRRLRHFFGMPPAAAMKIDLNDEDVVRYWAQEFDVDVSELRSAAQKVGPTVKAVREHFGK